MSCFLLDPFLAYQESPKRLQGWGAGPLGPLVAYDFAVSTAGGDGDRLQLQR